MTSWEILGIEPTDNSSIIKKAYAKKLKVHHPEDDPEGYQRLREAFDKIMKQQKVMASSKREQSGEEQDNRELAIEKMTIPEENAEQIVDEDFTQPSPFVDLNHIADGFHKKEAMVDEFMSKVETLYHDFPSRIEIDNWVELLNSDVIWNLELKRKLSFRLLDFVVEHHYLPKNIWRLLENSFQWKDEIQGNVRTFQEQVSEMFFIYYTKQLDDGPGFDYHILLEAEDIDYDSFLRYREEAIDALFTNNMTKAEDCLNKALTIFANDSDLLRIYGDLLFRSNRYEAASQVFRQMLQLNWKDLEARFYLAGILHKTNQLVESIQQCEKILSMKSDDLNALILQGKNYFQKGELNQSREIFKQVQEMEPNDLDVVIYLAKIHGMMYKETSEQRSKNKRPHVRVLQKELPGSSIVFKTTIFLGYLIRLRIIIFVVLAIIALNRLGELFELNPILMAMFIPIGVMIGAIQIDSSFPLDVLFWVGLLYIILFFMIKEVIKIYHAVRY
jgi:tetratricopeptide (TPR) repeat protein